MTDKEKLSVIKDYLKRLITLPCPDLTWFKAKEQAYKQVLELINSIDEQVDKCATCTNDKGCVTCENGEQWEGKAVDNTKSDNSQKNIECDLEDDYSDFMGLNRGAFCHQYKGDCEHCPYSSIKKTEGKPIERTDDELEESPGTDLFTSNEQKAIELCRKNYKNCNEMLCVDCPRQDFLATLIQMADFKDGQFKEELDHAYHCADHVQYMNGWRDAIEKAEDWLYEHSNECYITAKAYSDFHEAMREEAQK